MFIGESITALLFISACLETNDLLISLITSSWAAEMDGLNKEVDTQTGCLCSYVSVLHHHADVRYINAKFFIRMSYKYDSFEFRGKKKNIQVELSYYNRSLGCMVCLFHSSRRRWIIDVRHGKVLIALMIPFLVHKTLIWVQLCLSIIPLCPWSLYCLYLLPYYLCGDYTPHINKTNSQWA